MVDVAEVRIWGRLAGAIRWDPTQRLGFFQYAPEFLRNGWDLSPLHMPLSLGSRIHSFPELRADRHAAEDTFHGLPGLLSDALPDRYGHQLIDTWLAQQGRPAGSMNPVEKLCFIGRRAMGALEFDPPKATTASKSFGIDMHGLVEVAQRLLHDRETFLTRLSPEDERAMRAILVMGTSAGGARPKAVVAFNERTQEIRSGQGQIPRGFSHWLLKLDGVSGAQFGESSGWGRVEYAYYLMALACGIDMTESRLLEENGRAHFMTRRFDRDGNTRHHIQSLCGLQHYDYNAMDRYSYEQVFQTMRQLRLTYPEAEEMFRRMVFNVLATNYDDHTKNISFRLRQSGPWTLAPAYDLCFAYAPGNHWVSRQTLSVNGKRLDIDDADFMQLARDNNIKKAAAIIAHVRATVRQWPKFAARAGVRGDLQARIQLELNALK